MIGNLGTAIDDLLTASLPTLIGDAVDQVTVDIARPTYVVDPASADALAGAPRPDDQRDVLPFDPENPVGPHTITRDPYPGPKRIYLENSGGERVILTPKEVAWASDNPRQFTLALKPHRDTAGLDQMTVLYGITGIFTTIKAGNHIEVALTSTDADNLVAAEALVVSILQLNRETLMENAKASVSDGGYTAVTTIKKLTINSGATVAADKVVIVVDAESEIKASRALQSEEGVPIERIASPGSVPDPDRPVQIDPLLEA